jgi:hypothetical protein
MLYELMMPLYRVLQLVTLPLLQEPGPALTQLMSGPGKQSGRRAKAIPYLPTIPVQLPEMSVAAAVPLHTHIAPEIAGAVVDGGKQFLPEQQRLSGTNTRASLPDWIGSILPAPLSLDHHEEIIRPQQDIPYLSAEKGTPMQPGERSGEVAGNRVNYLSLVTTALVEPIHRALTDKLLPTIADAPHNSMHTLANIRGSSVVSHGLSLPAGSLAPITEHNSTVLWHTLLPDVMNDKATYADTMQMGRLSEMVSPQNPDTLSMPGNPTSPTSAERTQYATPTHMTVHVHNREGGTASMRQEIEAVLLEIFDTTNNQ